MRTGLMIAVMLSSVLSWTLQFTSSSMPTGKGFVVLFVTFWCSDFVRQLSTPCQRPILNIWLNLDKNLCQRSICWGFLHLEMISEIRSWVTGQASCWPPRGWGFTLRSRSFITPSPKRRRQRNGGSRAIRWMLVSSTPSSSSTVSTSGAWTSLRQKSDPDLQWQLTSCSDLCCMFPESCRIQSAGSLPHSEEASITHSRFYTFNFQNPSEFYIVQCNTCVTIYTYS